MEAVVRDETLDHFLVRKWHEGAPHGLAERSGRLCVTAGAIAERNLKRTLTTADVPASQAATYTTIEDVARAIVSAHHGSRGAIIDRHLLRRTVSAIIEDAHTPDPETALERLASRIEWDEDAYEQFTTELDSYFRASNAGALDESERDHDDLLALGEDLDDPFAEWRSVQGLEAFSEVHDELENRTSDLPDHVYLSRSHLVAAAREYVADEWTSAYPDIEWVGVATVNVFDNPTIRFLRALANSGRGPELNFFFRTGTRGSLVERLQAVGFQIREQPGYPPTPSDAASDAFAVATNDFHRSSPADTVELVESPDHRREVEAVATRLRDLFANDISPSDVLVVARDAGEYRPLVEDIFTNNEFPYHVETREPMANLPAYRFLKATVDLIAHQATTPDDPVEYTAITDPLRLGFCLSDDPAAPWPVPQAEFLRLEEELAASQDDSGARPIPAWLDFARAQSDVDREWDILSAFLEWVLDEAGRPMDDGDRLRDLVDRLLHNHVRQTVDADVESPPGPMVDPSRRDLSTKHSSHFASRLREQTGRLKAYVERAENLATAIETEAVDDFELDWELAAQALGDVMGEETYGTRSTDSSAIRVVDAGNTYFLDADHVFVLGLSAEQFPRELATPTFIHEDLHEAAYQSALGNRHGESPCVFYESRTSQYQQELDLYQVATQTCDQSLTLLHNYLDSESDPVAWSSFVDFLNPDFEHDDFVNRIHVHEWLPTAGDDDRFWPRLAGRDRLRAYTFHAAEADHVAGPVIDQPEFMRLALWTEGNAYRDTIEPRIDRLTTEVFAISVQAGDAGVSSGFTLDDITGGPVLPHEADLYAQCELKYYYYQYLFNRDGDHIARETIPADVTEQPTSRFGRLPAVVREQHVAGRYEEAIRFLIEEMAPDRQDTLGGFGEPAELVAWWRTNAPDDAPRSIVQSLIREYRQVQAELDAGIDRNWNWRYGRRVEIDDRALELGSHRVDTVVLPATEGGTEADDEEACREYDLPVFYVAGRDYAERAVKHCWQPTDSTPERPEYCDNLCQQCDVRDECRIRSKFTLDHRLHGTALAYDDPLGVVFVEQGVSRPRARQGYLVEQESTVPDRDTFERTLTRITPDEWRSLADSWRFDLDGHITDMAPDSTVTYQVDPRFVSEGTDEFGNFDGSGDDGCATCVYRDLCQLPRKVNEQ